MANADAPFGFEPVTNRNASNYYAVVNEYSTAAADGTAIFIGDPVIITGTADAEGVPTVTQATAGATNYVTGVMVGIKPVTDESPVFREASSTTSVRVLDDPYAVFLVQADGALAVTDVGNTADFSLGSGSTATGLSTAELDSSSIGTGDQLVIERVLQRADNEVGANAICEVRFNLHQARNTTGV